MNVNEIQKVIDKINIFDIPYEVNVFKAEKLANLLVEREPKLAKDLRGINSILVYTLYAQANDFYIREDFTLNLLAYLKYWTKYEFFDDNLEINRVDAAVLAGLIKISKTNQFFSYKLGFKCKIGLVLTTEIFDEYNDFNGNHILEYCEECKKYLTNSECHLNCSYSKKIEKAIPENKRNRHFRVGSGNEIRNIEFEQYNIQKKELK